ncbi:MAG: beta-ketoacyl-[acyl-carrier-protein] synthase family protein [Planctomycetes bacterium]|nr:beta-ketoacyl-[acyl-carrier-protein] synthase family protein [Planctomycetota bacterium]
MQKRIVITGVGLTSPIGNDLATLRQNLLAGKPNVQMMETRYMDPVPAGICDYEVTKYQTRKDARRGTRAGSISIYCANEAVNDAGINLKGMDTNRVGVFVGTTEHGNVETENEVANLKEFDYDVKYWSHHHNPRSVSNNPAGEVNLNMDIHGPHCCIGAACAAGNYGIIYGAQQLMLGEVDVAIAGGISEAIRTFGIFASFKAQNALGHHEDPNKTSRPFDTARNGIVVAEGGCLYTLERLEDALARGAKIYGEIAGYHTNTDATDFVLPNPERQAECMQAALKKAGMEPGDIDLINCHATATPEGDPKEISAIKSVFGEDAKTWINATKGFYGHAMGAAGSLELAGNLPAFEDGVVHPSINCDELDPACAMPNLVLNKAVEAGEIRTILNNSFGMLGTNAVLIIKKYQD